MKIKKVNIFSVILGSLFIISIFGCKDGINNPQSICDNTLCYEKQYLDKWEIFTNNISGSNLTNISNYLDNDEYPQWSPNGKNIAFIRSIPVGGPLVYVYNCEKNTTINLTDDGGGASKPNWTSSGKIYFSYRNPIGAKKETYIMNPDGSEKRKILGSDAIIYFYQNSYTFLYIIDSKIYKTDIGNSSNELLFDLQPGNNKFLTIRDFNPIEGKLLINTNIFPGVENAIVEYSIETKEMELLVSAEIGFTLSLQRYSKDYSKIAFIETKTNEYSEHFLSILENGKKRRLVKLDSNSWFDFNPMEFSSDEKYIAFSKNINSEGDWVHWKSDLYVVEIKTSELHFIDEGKHPSWNSNF